MSAWLQSVLGSFKARLSQYIIFWVFASLVLIEAIILIPSYSPFFEFKIQNSKFKIQN